MAKKTQSPGMPAIPDFRDVDAAAVAAAQAAIGGGAQSKPLVVPKGTEKRMDKKQTTSYSRWQENIVITQAYRTVTKTGLLDVTVGAKVRQSEDNNNARVWFHYYINVDNELPDGHTEMNERSYGSIVSLLNSTGYMPANGTLKGTLLTKMFPQKNQPGMVSPLIGKSVLVNVVQQEGPRRDPKTKNPVKDKEGKVVLDKRDNGESYLPDDEEEADDSEE